MLIIITVYKSVGNHNLLPLMFLLLLPEPPHLEQSKQNSHPDQQVRDDPPQSGGGIGAAGGPAAFPPPKKKVPRVELVGVLRDKGAANVDQAKVGADQAVGIQAGGLSALVAAFNGHCRYSVVVIVVADTAASSTRVFRFQEVLVVVPAVVADEFSAHGVGEYVRAAIIVARDAVPVAIVYAARFVVAIVIVIATIVVVAAAKKAFPSKRAERHQRSRSSWGWYRAAPVYIVGQAGVAKGHAIAFLAPQTGTTTNPPIGIADCFLVVAAAAINHRIKGPAVVAPFLVLLLGVAFGTAV